VVICLILILPTINPGMRNIPAIINNLFNKAKTLFMGELNQDLADSQSHSDFDPVSAGTETREKPLLPSGRISKITWLRGITAIFNGLGLGLLLGMLLGLSISPVVSGVIASLTGLLAVLLGLNEQYLDPLKSMRIGSFGFAAVVGIIAGLHIRANDSFAPTMREKMDYYLEIGYSAEEARGFITKSIEADPDKAKREAGVLYSSTVDASACDVLQYASADQPVSEVVNTFREAGGAWKELAEVYNADLPENLAGKSLISIRDCFCNIASGGKIKMTSNKKVSGLGSGDSLDHIEQVLSAVDVSWKAIVNRFSADIPASERKAVYLSTIKVLTND